MADGAALAGMDGETDDALVARAKAGDRRAFETIARRHFPAIRRFAWRVLGDAAEADDVAQEALIRIARGLDGFGGRAAFSSWSLGVTLNCARDALRARTRRARLVEEMRADAAVLEAATEAADAEDAEIELWRAVRNLPDAQRDAVLLVHVEGLSHRAAADALGCAEATVSWRLFSARRRLKAALSRTDR